MDWTLESFTLSFEYRYRENLIDTVSKVFSILPNYRDRFIPTEAYTVDSEPFRFRTDRVDLTNPEAVVRLGQGGIKDGASFAVTLYDDAKVALDWSMGSDPEYGVDALRVSLHRDHLQNEKEAQVLLALACELQPVLMPVVGEIVDYKVESTDPVSFEYHRNGHDLPQRIYWANFWGPAMVEHLGGMKKVMAAPAHEVKVFADGGVMLLSMPTLLTYTQAADVAHRQAIWEWFNLPHLHEELSSIKEKERLEKRKAIEGNKKR